MNVFDFSLWLDALRTKSSESPTAVELESSSSSSFSASNFPKLLSGKLDVAVEEMDRPLGLRLPPIFHQFGLVGSLDSEVLVGVTVVEVMMGFKSLKVVPGWRISRVPVGRSKANRSRVSLAGTC